MPRPTHTPGPAFASSPRPAARRPAASRGGFALLITITLVAFLVLILVGLASFTRVETTVAGNSQQMAMARQNALTALNIALGELQKYAGPDQRATATAAIDLASPAPGTRHWTGVWGNSANPQADLSTTPARLQWLVSGNERLAFDPASHVSSAADSFGRVTTAPSGWAYTPASATTGLAAGVSPTDDFAIANEDAALLVGPRTAGDDPDSYVLAPLVDIDIPADSIPGLGGSDDVTVGRYAWWIGDEGVKARVNLVDPYVLPTSAMAAAAVVAEPASPFRLMAPQRSGVERVPGFATFPVNTSAARDVLTVEQAAFADANITPAVHRARFHDLTAVAHGVVADSLRGGLKRDLTHAFARDDLAEFRAALGLDPAAVNRLIPTSIMPASEQGPTWEQLRSYGRLDGSAPVAPRPQTATEHGIYPILAQARIGVGGRIVADGANSRFIVRISPSFVLANPYNATLAGATYRLRVDFAANSHLSAFIGSTTNGSPSFWRMPLRELLEGQVFEVTTTDIGPGEAHIFTLASDGAPWAPVQTLAMDNDWSDFAIELDTSAHGGETFDESVPFAYPNPAGTPANLPAKGVHLAFGDGHPTTTGNWGTTSGVGPRLTGTSGGTQRGGTLSWALLDTDNTVLQRIETMGYSVNPASMYGIRGETIQNSGASILMMADAGTFTATRAFPYYSQFNWRAPLINRTTRYGSRINALASWHQSFHQGTSAAPVLERWVMRQQTTPPFTHVEWNGVVGTHLSRPLARDDWRAFDIPRASTGLVSLGQLQHFNAAGHHDITYPAPASPMPARPLAPGAQRPRYLTPAYAIGNSRANPHVASASVRQVLDGEPYYDVSYVLNRTLLDGYFFSAYPQTGPVDLATERLPNPRLRPFRDDISPAYTAAFRGSDSVFSPAHVRNAARNLMLAGAFNVNSTSVSAWTAVLSALRDTEFNGETGLEGPFPRSIHQPGGKTGSETGSTADAWNGFRDLTPAQIDALATALVAEIRARGPVVSLADFVNRRLTSSTAAHTHAGPLQAAIDATDINAAFINTATNTGGTTINFPTPAASTGTLPYDHTDHLAKHGLEGIAGWLTQADLFQALAPMLSARGDTFRIRTYGETRNPVTGDPVGRAWCEAIVQRLPDYVSDADDAVLSPSDLTSADNRHFGRRFVVVDFRWLAPDDI